MTRSARSSRDWGDRQPERRRGLAINDQLELGGLFDIPSRSSKTFYDPEPHRVGDDRHDDWDCAGSLLDGNGSLGTRNDDVYLETDQVGGKTRQRFESPLCPPVLDGDVSPFDIATLAES